ncbi:glycosyltransferase family 4 protein, partial [Alphaproteobacteria bacterium]|nr:glycosyltransferase family 4 protein [Alphaproteobacteria bacterium]
MKNTKKLIIVGTLPSSLINFRGELLKEFVSKGFNVIALASGANFEEITEIESLGVKYIDTPVKNTSINPLIDIKTIKFYKSIFKKEKPDYVLSYSIKPIIWSGVALRSYPTIQFTALITGLGYVFSGSGFIRNILRWLVSILYKISLKRANNVIFQNWDNLDRFVKLGLVLQSKTHRISGSGVNIKNYNFTKLPKTKINFLCIARLLGEKGLREYAAAAKIVKNKFPSVIFQLVGPSNYSRDAISLDEIHGWSNYLTYNNATKDVRPFIKKCHVFVLPSYHEGIPRSTLEAMSMGRPVITTNAVGCKDTVVEKRNGFKVPIKSAQAIAKKMFWFIE